MVRKQGAKNNNKRKVSKAVKPSKMAVSSKTREKKIILQKKQNIALLKSPQSKLKQLSNYRAFINHLLYGDIDGELADGAN